MASVTGARALVFGGASGIGAACVSALADQGWSVLVADLQPVPAKLPVAGSATVDVRDAEAVAAAVAELADGETLTGLVYAAGVGHVAPLAEIDPGRWKLIVDVNLTGAFHALRATLPTMTAGGSLVFISSIDAGQPVSGLAHYCAAKAGLEALSRSAALELGPAGIRSNVVAPGPVETPLMRAVLADPERAAAFSGRTPLGSIGTPAQVAATVAFLLGERSAHVTGARLPVDGGLSLREHPTMLTNPERTP